MATSSQFNRGYGGGLAANARPRTGLAGGSQQGGGFRPSIPSSFMAPRMSAPAMPKPPAQQPFRPLAGMDYGAPSAAQGYGGQAAQPQQAPPAPDMQNFFGPAPLPAPGDTQNFNKQPPSPFGGPEPLPSFGGFREAGGPVTPGQAYVVGERGPEVIVPQMPGMVVPNQSAIRQSPMNRSQNTYTFDMSRKTNRESFGNYAWDATLGGSDFEALQNGSFGHNSLANRAAVPVGRSANDINRIAEQQRRRGNFRPIMQLGMMDKQQQFYNGQNDKNFAQGQQMWKQNQQAQAAQYQQQRADQGADYQRNQTDQQKQDEARRQWDMTQHGIKTGEQAMENERKRQQDEMDRQAKMQFGLKPLQVPGTQTPYFQDYNGSVHAGGAPAPLPPAIPPGYAPKSVNVNGTTYAPPVDTTDYLIGRVPGPMMKDPVTGKDVPGPDIPVRINKKTGQYTRLTEEQAAGQGGAAAPAAPDKPAWSSWLDEQTPAK